MAVSPRLTRALQQALGEDAAEDFLALMESRDVQYAELRADMAELRQEMRVGFARVDVRFAETRLEWVAEFGKLRTEMGGLRTEMVDRMERRYSQLLLWSFTFWLTSMITMAFILRELR